MRRAAPLLLAALTAAPFTLLAQAGPTGPLEFFGFRPGSPRAEIEASLRDHHGRWSCRTSTIDPRLTECRGTLRPDGEPSLEVTGSLVGRSVAVLLLAAPIDDARLERWVDDLSTRYGRVAPRTSNGQTVWQWVRRQRMIRLTTRIEEAGRVASISLVDGPLLDSLDGEPR